MDGVNKWLDEELFGKYLYMEGGNEEYLWECEVRCDNSDEGCLLVGQVLPKGFH